VPLDVLREARHLCADFRIPPRQFRRRTPRGAKGSYYPETDIVAINVDRADRDGMGGDDGYDATLLHELLHATGHQRRLARATTGDFSRAGYGLEEGTILEAQRILLREIGFGAEPLDWHAPKKHGFPVDRKPASKAAAWLLYEGQTVTTWAIPADGEQLALFPEEVGTEDSYCPHCGQYYAAGQQRDPCVGRDLPGIWGCCCGHGDISRAVVDPDSSRAEGSRAWGSPVPGGATRGRRSSTATA
jgi:Zincin-like metallopeptidase